MFINSKRSRIIAALMLAAAAASHAQARDLTVAGWGGSSQDAQRKIYYRPFQEKMGTKLVEDTWSGGMGVLRAKAQNGNPDWDVVMMEAEEAVLGCEEGLFQKMDWSKIGPRESFIPAAAGNDCAVGAMVWSVGIMYDGDKIKEGPKSWAEFWDLEKYPGKRALRRGPKYTLEFALMADGVPASDVYKVLRSPEGVDRAFRKLDQIKSSVVWFTSGSQPPQLVISGEVALAAGYASRVGFFNAFEKKNLKFIWPQSIYAVDFWAIYKGTPFPKQALELVYFMTRPENQSKLPSLAFQGVTNVEAAKLAAAADPESAKAVPTDPDNLKVAIPLDADFWVENIDQLTQRFNAWVSK